MNSKNDDFPTPVSPTRRIVYGVFAGFVRVLMIPYMRDTNLLENQVRAIAPNVSFVTFFIARVLSSS